MVRPISLRLRHAEIVAKARAALGSVREARLKQSHDAAVMRRARATVARAKEQNRLQRCAVLAAQKAVLAVKQAYAAQDKVADEFDRERWLGLRDFVVSELERIVEGRRP
jgi:hypothetical protein